MLRLAEPLSYDDLLTFYLSSTPRSTIVKRLVCYGFGPNTKKGYAIAINFYVSFCVVYNEKPWLEQTIMIEKWETTRIFGSTLPKQGQIKPDTVVSCLLALKSYHIDSCLNLTGFNDLHIALIINGGKRLFSSKKLSHLPIIKNIFEKIMEDEPLSVTDLNVNMIFKVDWAGFMRMRELT